MKTATVTWISDNNYGTLLQAYALQQKIFQLGHENIILSDRAVLQEIARQKQKSMAPQHSTVVEPERVPFRARVIRLLEHPRRLPRVLLARISPEKYSFPYTSVQDKCAQFKQDALCVYDIKGIDQLSTLDCEFDAFISGSDQIWSILAHRFHPYYFLNFSKKKKIAYAPSMGTDRIPKADFDTIREYTKDYTAVSVRETVSAHQLSDVLERDIFCVADPTLLHEAQFWSDFASSGTVCKKPYLLCYFLENKPWYFTYAENLAKKMHLKILLIPNKSDFLSSEYLICQGVGPREFVGLFENAAYVLTDSYHGSIFSVIFQKNFQYLLRFAQEDPNSQNIRIQSLFERLGLENRIVSQNMLEGYPLQIEYIPINEKLNEFRVSSEEYLRQALKNT